MFTPALWVATGGFSGLAAAEEPPCPTRLERLDMIDAAEQELILTNLDAARQRLRQLEAVFGCGPLAESEVLGRTWLAQGAIAALSGKPGDSVEPWRSAARVAPGRWVAEYGQVLRDQYELAIEAPAGEPSTLVLDPPLFRWIGAVDGQVVEFPAEVPPGLHLVQVGADELHVSFARVVVTEPGEEVLVQTGISEPSNFVAAPDPEPAAPQPGKVRPPPRAPARASLYTAVGADLALGRGAERDGAASVEPATRISFPLETGFVVRPGAAWVRVAGLAAPLVGGVFLYDDKYGPTETPVALGGSLAVGSTARQGDIGLMGGYRWPDRVPVRVVVALRAPRAPVQLEGRLGMNAAFGRPPEPAFELSFALTPTLFRHPE